MAQRMLDRALNSLLSPDLVVLAYHGIDDADTFGRHLGQLVEARTPVSLQAVISHVQAGEPLPHRPVLVTFDDGDRSIFDVGRSLLAAHRVPAVAFVVTGLIGTDQPFWWDEVVWLSENGGVADGFTDVGHDLVRRLKTIPDPQRLHAIDELRATARRPAPRHPQLTRSELGELVDAGIEIGSHTVTHPCLDQCPTGVVDRELTASALMLEQALGQPTQAFAYPNGNVTPKVERATERAGYEVAFAFDHRVCGSSIPPHRVSRVRVDSTAAMPRFRLLLSGAHSFQHHARGRR